MLEKLSAKQTEAVNFVLHNKQCALYCEQRTGKTWITLGVIESLISDEPDVCLVVPLTNKQTTWATSLLEFPGYTVAQTWEEFKVAPKPRLYLEHYEALIKLKKSQKKRFQNHPWGLIVVDECQRIKSRGSSISRVLGLVKKAEYRVGLSGTPIDDSPIDLWSQFKFIRPELFGTKWSLFDAEYLTPTGYMGYKRKFRADKYKEFTDKIEPYIFRLTKEEVGIKESEVTLVPVSMLGSQRRLYDDMEENMVARPVGTRVTAKLRITQMVKLQQFCNGFVIDDEGDTHIVGKAKLRKARALLERARLPAVIFCKYTQDVIFLKELLEDLEITHRCLYGKVKDTKKHKARTQVLEDFQNRKYDVLICQIRTGGVGVDLWKAKSLIFFSMTFSFIDYVQAKARGNHYSKKRPADIYLIFCKDSIDEDIYSTILSKQSVNHKLFNQLKKRFRNGKRRS